MIQHATLSSPRLPLDSYMSSELSCKHGVGARLRHGACVVADDIDDIRERSGLDTARFGLVWMIRLPEARPAVKLSESISFLRSTDR